MSFKYSGIGGSDFDIDLEAARFLNSGISAYAGPNTHPPLSIIFALCFLPLSSQAAFLVYNAISLGVYLYGCWLTVQRLDLSLNWKVALIAGALLWPTQLAGPALGSVSALLSGLILIAWHLLQARREWLAPILLGICTLLKIYPGFLALYLFAQSNWRILTRLALSVLLVSLLSLAIVPATEYLNFLSAARVNAELYLDFRTNHSLISLSEKMFGHATGWVQPVFEMPFVAKLLGISLTIAASIYAYFKAKLLLTSGEEDKAFSVLLCFMLLVSPISWGHYQSVLILPIGIALQDSLKNQRFSSLSLVLILTTGMMSSVTDNLGRDANQLNLPWVFSLGAYAESLGIFLLALICGRRSTLHTLATELSN